MGHSGAYSLVSEVINMLKMQNHLKSKAGTCYPTGMIKMFTR